MDSLSPKPLLSLPKGKLMMKYRGMAILWLSLFTVLSLYGQEVIEEIVAIVNDDIITLSQYKAEEETLYRMLSEQLKGDELAKQFALNKKYILDRMIDNLLLLQEAKKKDINVKEQLKMMIEKLKKDNSIDSYEELIRAISKQGMDFEAWKKQAEEYLLAQGVVYSELQSSIIVEDSEILNYYKLHPQEFTEPAEYKLRAIFISSEGRTEAEIEAKKSEVSQKIASGQDFASLAGSSSEGPEKQNQGDLGRFKKGELEKSLEQAVESLKVGEVTPWLPVKGGWYILKLEEKKDSRLKSFEEAKNETEEKLFNQKRQEKYEEFMKKLRERSYIKILKPDILGY
jgi:parvulin-like peptidyl-prolyl isomerase